MTVLQFTSTTIGNRDGVLTWAGFPKSILSLSWS